MAVQHADKNSIWKRPKQACRIVLLFWEVIFQVRSVADPDCPDE